MQENLRARGLLDAHRVMVERARGCLPFEPTVMP
jgi:hypothetical protein